MLHLQRAAAKGPTRWNTKHLPADLQLLFSRSKPPPDSLGFISSAETPGGVNGDPLAGGALLRPLLPFCLCGAHPKSGRSNEGAARTAGRPLARRPHDKTVVNKPRRRSEPPSYNSDKRPMSAARARRVIAPLVYFRRSLLTRTWARPCTCEIRSPCT